jgi:hypothetical protein
VTAQTQEAGGVSSQVNLYDSEIIAIEKVLEKLNGRREKTARMSYEAFTDEVKNRFHEIGLVVSVLWFEAGAEQPDGTLKKIEGTLIPEIVIKARTDAKTFAFDHERMQHEVQSDLLELGTGGKLKLTAEDARKILATEQGHKHGKGCGH